MSRLPRRRRFLTGAALTAALSLLVGLPLVLTTGTAGAEPLPKVSADFTVAPGQSVEKENTKPLINNAELRPSATDCRENPAIGLTCAVYRIKLTTLAPGYFVRISTTWTAADAGGVTSVPDIDTYLWADTSAAMDYNTIGGVSGAVPEQIKLVNPKQTEYDFVVSVYAGAIASHKVLVQYLNEAAGPTPAKPDILLAPKDKPFAKQISGVMVGYTGQPALYAVIKQKPDACRNDPTAAALCDVYRLKLNRNRAKDASNLVVITLEWEARQLTPDLVVGVAGLEAIQDPNLDMFIWDSATHVLERGQVGGESGSMPERIAFTATQDEYDLVVQIANGANTNYTLRAFMSDEIFDKPFELLDPITGEPISTPISDGSGGFVSPVDGTVVTPPLALAPIDVDDQIAGIGLGTTEQFDNQDLLELGRSAMRNTATSAKAPSAVLLWIAMVILPAAVAAASVVVLRRRRNEAF